MELRILDDLHIEFEGFEPPVTDADVVIMAGVSVSAWTGWRPRWRNSSTVRRWWLATMLPRHGRCIHVMPMTR
jgi:hypothetical protein